MLAYAFQVLKEQGYEECANEEFDNIGELLSAILVRGVKTQIKRGLGRAYIEETDNLKCVRGKINVTESVKTMSILKQELVCSYDEFSINSYLNRIIKTTLEILIHSDVSKERKKEIKFILGFFNEVDVLDKNNINWSIRFNRNNQSYRMLIYICYLIIKGVLQTDVDGNIKLQKFIDEQRMCRLYEKFILAYYQKEHKELTASALQVDWAVDNPDEFLPTMQTDITLQKGNRTLIIDAKYYSRMTQVNYNRHTYHSNNMYQIFTYVKNYQEAHQNVETAGMLLYAKTDEEVVPNSDYTMSNNRISVKSLDLNVDFEEIKEQLDSIAINFFRR